MPSILTDEKTISNTYNMYTAEWKHKFCFIYLSNPIYPMTKVTMIDLL